MLLRHSTVSYKKWYSTYTIKKNLVIEANWYRNFCMRHHCSVDLWATSWDIMSFASFWMSAELCVTHASSGKISIFPVKLVGQGDDSEIRFPSISNPCCFRASLKASRTLRAHQERTTRLELWRLFTDTCHQSVSGSRCASIWRILGRIGWT